MKTTFKLTAIAAVAVTLTACGGGGGGGGGSPISNATTPVVSTIDTVTGPTDVNGGKFAAIFSAPLTLSGFDPSANLNGRTLQAAHPEASEAHAQGWTGMGVNTLVVDFFTTAEAEKPSHGSTVSFIFLQHAPGSETTIVNLPTAITGTDRSYRTYQLEAVSDSASTVHDRTIAQNRGHKDFKVINYSLGSNLADDAETQQRAAKLIVDLSKLNGYAVSTNVSQAQVPGSVTVSNTFTTTDATIVKAAGNHTVRAETDAVNTALYNDANTNRRLLLVGATDHTSSVNTGSATLASYSNTCGNFCDRFITAGGNDPLGTGDEGTSYAAPRVAAYVALVRQKFDTISGERAANRMLQTARTDTINNYEQSIHGVGEASLARALAPSARIR